MVRDDDGGRVKRWRELLDSERDAAALYARIAEAETGERQKIFEELAAVERRHAAHWEDKIRGAGETVPPTGKPSLRTRLLVAGPKGRPRRRRPPRSHAPGGPAARLTT